jgi:hypothetical protein
MIKLEYMTACKVCGYNTLPENDDYEICQVCFWQSDPSDPTNPDEVSGGANSGLSLNQAILNYKKFGAVEERFVGNVRKPKDSELTE